MATGQGESGGKEAEKDVALLFTNFVLLEYLVIFNVELHPITLERCSICRNRCDHNHCSLVAVQPKEYRFYSFLPCTCQPMHPEALRIPSEKWRQ